MPMVSNERQMLQNINDTTDSDVYIDDYIIARRLLQRGAWLDDYYSVAHGSWRYYILKYITK